jgi:hypothetical protein
MSDRHKIVLRNISDDSCLRLCNSTIGHSIFVFIFYMRLHLSACSSLSFIIPTMSTDSQQITNSIRRRLADLQTYQLPRLRDCKGPIDLQRDLAAELKDDIRKVKRSIDVSLPWERWSMELIILWQELDALAYDKPTEREREETMGTCRELNQELDR